MSDLPVEYLKQNKCSEQNCYRFCAKGYTLCPGHLWGFSKKMDEEDIKKLKEASKNAGTKFVITFEKFLLTALMLKQEIRMKRKKKLEK